MAIHLIGENWGSQLETAIAADPSELRIVCPFIKVGALERLLQHRPSDVQVITRFSLDDFVEGVSDIAALRKLLDVNAKIRGVKNLHAKLYIFGRSRAIITSANLTEAALNRNQELGIVAERAAVLRDCLQYFNGLWGRAGDDLHHAQVEEWERSVAEYRVRGGRLTQVGNLPDVGTDIGLPAPPHRSIPPVVADAPQAFVKFAGEANNRRSLDYPTIDEIKGGGCHLAVWYPKNKRPRKVKDGTVMFISRMTHGPNDMRIFGRALGMAYVERRDDASENDIAMRSWTENWNRCIRVYNAEFVDGTLENGVSLNKLMDTLGKDSFVSTQRRANRGVASVNPRRAYGQHPAVELSPEGYFWLNEQLQKSFDLHGKISEERLAQLDWPDPSTILAAYP